MLYQCIKVPEWNFQAYGCTAVVTLAEMAAKLLPVLSRLAMTEKTLVP